VVGRDLRLGVEHNLVWTLHETIHLVICDAANFLALRPRLLPLGISHEFTVTGEVNHRLRRAWLLTNNLGPTFPFFLQVLLLLELFLLEILHQDLVFLCKRCNRGRRGQGSSHVRQLLRSGVERFVLVNDLKSLTFAARGVDSALRY